MSVYDGRQERVRVGWGSNMHQSVTHEFSGRVSDASGDRIPGALAVRVL
jgi:hypothetical protein